MEIEGNVMDDDCVFIDLESEKLICLGVLIEVWCI